MQLKDREERKNTFTKSILSIIVMLYFIGSIIGTALVITAAVVDIKLGYQLDVSMFVAYAAYLGGPTATSIIFYAWKSKAENVLKIGQSFELEKSVEVMDVISKMGGN